MHPNRKTKVAMKSQGNVALGSLSFEGGMGKVLIDCRHIQAIRSVCEAGLGSA
jgi:hypothetical protein